MNEIKNKFSFAGDKFMSEMRWRQTGFTYNASGSFTNNIDRIQTFKKPEIHGLFFKMN